eukprot:314305_1
MAKTRPPSPTSTHRAPIADTNADAAQSLAIDNLGRFDPEDVRRKRSESQKKETPPDPLQYSPDLHASPPADLSATISPALAPLASGGSAAES